MNKQEMFNKVKKRLLDGKGMAVNNMGLCAYENEDGLRCAVGVLFPDEMPKEIKKTNLSVSELILSNKLNGFVPDHIRNNIFFVKSLQAIHDWQPHWDGNTFCERGIRYLKEIARKHGLEYNDE